MHACLVRHLTNKVESMESAMQSEKDIIQNLQDAGCSEKDIGSIMTCYRDGDQRKMERLIAACRKKQLERLHDSQVCIDRLDFLSYQLAKE